MMKINHRKIQLLVAIAFLASLAGISHGTEVLQWSGETNTAGAFIDASGNGNTGDADGGATLAISAPGLVGNAIYLDGNGAFVQNWNTTGLPTLAADTWSMNAYVKFDAAAENWAQIYNFGSGSYDTKNRGLVTISPPDPPTLRFVTSSAGDDQLFTTAITDVGVWHMFTVTCDGANITMYRDGTQIGTEPYTSGAGTITLADGDPRAMVGRPGWSTYIEGLVDEFTIWDNTLNQTEINVLAQALVPEPASMLIMSSFIFAFLLKRK